jgi:hypothetical protein
LQQPSPQLTSFLPLIAALIIAAAHPTPLYTLMSEAVQFNWHALHSMKISEKF